MASEDTGSAAPQAVPAAAPPPQPLAAPRAPPPPKLLEQSPVLFYVIGAAAWTFFCTRVTALYREAALAAPDGRLPPKLQQTITLLSAIAGLGPAVTGITLTLTTEGDRGLQRLVRGLTQPFPLRLLAWCLAPLALQAGLWYAWAVSYSPDSVAMLATPRFRRHAAGALIAGITSGLAQELGWRGHMFFKLGRLMPPLRGALVTGFAWALWSALPQLAALTVASAPARSGAETTEVDAEGGETASPAALFLISALRLLALVPLSVILGTLFIKSRGSLLLCLIFHASVIGAGILFDAPLTEGGVTPRALFASLLVLGLHIAAAPAYWFLSRGFLSAPAQTNVSSAEDAPAADDDAATTAPAPAGDAAPEAKQAPAAAASGLRQRKPAAPASDE